MKKVLHLLFILFLTVSIPSEAFFDLIKTYSKRNIAIKDYLISSLEERKEGIEWIAIAHGYPDEVQVDFVFVPEGSTHNEWSEKVTYSEINLEKHETLKTFDELLRSFKNRLLTFYRNYDLLIKTDSCVHEEAYNDKSDKEHYVRIIRKVGDWKYQLLSYELVGSNLTDEQKQSWFKTLESIRIKY